LEPETKPDRKACMEFRSLAENISFVHRASRVFQEPGAKQAKQRQMVLKEVAVPCAV
jgi:hypothetical protein